MPSGYKVAGVDLDTLFAARGSTTARAATGYKVAGTDIAQRYKASIGGDTIASPTGYKVAGTDLQLLFQDINYAAPPVITDQPDDWTDNEGETVSLVLTATGAPTLTYQWRKGGVDISGATGYFYNIVGSLYTDSGSYDCVVTNSFGSATSTAVTVTVHRNPYITSEPSDWTGHFGDTISFTVGAGGDGTLYYDWYFNGAFVGTFGSTASFGASDFGQDGLWQCIVRNSYGGFPANTATVDVHTEASLAITSQPVGFSTPTHSVGINFLSVSAVGDNTGTYPLTYQWYQDGSPVGGNSSSYNWLAMSHADEGDYFCRVSDGYGNTIDSDTVHVTVTSSLSITSQPSDQNVQDGVGPYAVQVGATSNGSLHYQWYHDGSPVGTDSYQHVVNPALSSADFGDYYCHVTDSYGDYEDSDSAHIWPYPVIDTQPYDATGVGLAWTDGVGPFGIKIDAHSSAGVHYQWYHDGSPIGSDSDQHVVNPASLSDAGEYWCVITDGNGLQVESDHATVSVS